MAKEKDLYTFLRTYKEENQEIYFQLENDIHIYKGKVSSVKLNIFEPTDSIYYVEVIDSVFQFYEHRQTLSIPNLNIDMVLDKPTLSKKQIVEITLHDFVLYVSESVLTSKLLTSSSGESFTGYNIFFDCYYFSYSYIVNNFKSLNIEIVNKVLYEFNIYFQNLRSLSNYNTKLSGYGKFFRINEEYIVSPSKSVYVIKDNIIQVCRVFRVFLDPDSISELYSKDILNFMYWGKKSKFIYGLIDSNGTYFETKIIYKKKKDLQNLITALPTV